MKKPTDNTPKKQPQQKIPRTVANTHNNATAAKSKLKPTTTEISGKSSEIDDIFGVRAKKATPATPSSPTAKAAQVQSTSLIQSKVPVANATLNDAEFADSRGVIAKKRRVTDDGLLIFTEEELNIGKGGDTADCPFDCSCCF